MKSIGRWVLDPEPLGKGQFGAVHKCRNKEDKN